MSTNRTKLDAMAEAMPIIGDNGFHAFGQKFAEHEADVARQQHEAVVTLAAWERDGLPLDIDPMVEPYASMLSSEQVFEILAKQAQLAEDAEAEKGAK